jgi:hypothetical protein
LWVVSVKGAVAVKLQVVFGVQIGKHLQSENRKPKIDRLLEAPFSMHSNGSNGG